MPFDPQKIQSFPRKPGVYIMKDVKGRVIYIGKANNLRQRVKQYFVPGRDERPQVPFLRKAERTAIPKSSRLVSIFHNLQLLIILLLAV